MKNQDKQKEMEEKMIQKFQVEELEKRCEMAWLSGEVVNGDTGYVYVKGQK